jgi:hypothetical protein
MRASRACTSPVTSLTKSRMIRFFWYRERKTESRSLLSAVSEQPIYFLMRSKHRLISAYFYRLFLYYWSILKFYYFFN